MGGTVGAIYLALKPEIPVSEPFPGHTYESMIASTHPRNDHKKDEQDPRHEQRHSPSKMVADPHAVESEF